MVIPKKKVFTSNQQNETTWGIFEGAPKKGVQGNCLIHLTQYPSLCLRNVLQSPCSFCTALSNPNVSQKKKKNEI